MKKCLFHILFLSFFIPVVNASDKDSTVYYPVPDSIKAISFIAEINVLEINTTKEVFTGIRADRIKLVLESDKDGKEVVFEFPASAQKMAKGIDVIDDEKGELEWKYDWSVNVSYKLLVSIATDSAENFSLYSGYIWLPKEHTWKLIGTCKIQGQWSTLQNPAVFFPDQLKKRPQLRVQTSQVGLQKNNGKWISLKEGQPEIKVRLFSHIDSVRQNELETQIIQQAIATGKTDETDNVEGVYYKIMKEGTGRQVSVNDTITVLYKLNVFNNASVVEESTDKPITFPLKWLIKGWQVGVPLCKVGGKIKLLIPSGMSYSIRTKGAKLPTHSILQFEIEVVESKPPL